MNRRFFLRAALASTATIVVAPACVLDELDEEAAAPQPRRTYVDMGKNPLMADGRPTPGELYSKWDIAYLAPFYLIPSSTSKLLGMLFP